MALSCLLQSRHILRAEGAHKYKKRMEAKKIFNTRKEEEAAEMTADPLEEMFHTT